MQVGRDLRKCFSRFEAAELVLGRCLGDRWLTAPSQKGFPPTEPPRPRLPSPCNHKTTLDTSST